MSPKVFLSHAKEDKDRFVLDFAEKLRNNGIDVWLDKWEMLPGDSLIDKIFEEGLKNAEAIIIVLSSHSVNKPWVKEELNAGVMKRIGRGTKIIPVVIDNCSVPESLKSTLWERISDTTNYQENLDRIVASIFGHREKPPIGQPPFYTKSLLYEIPGLTRIDNLVLKDSCEAELREYKYIVNPKDLFLKNGDSIIPEGELSDSLEMLAQYGHIRLHRTLGKGPYEYEITLLGFDKYASAYIADYQQIIHEVIVLIVNQRLRNNLEIADRIGKPLKLIDHILDLLESNGHVKLSKELGGGVHIYDISPALRRMLQ
ncbi:MAG: toll/interleukin-1 receptor domain-containing protein [Desulfobacteraceae bacterium]|nr:MAG: toll/interleukin-1 receptor domain-containing protein [Desulfobacteraceae bacterium]